MTILPFHPIDEMANPPDDGEADVVVPGFDPTGEHGEVDSPRSPAVTFRPSHRPVWRRLLLVRDGFPLSLAIALAVHGLLLMLAARYLVREVFEAPTLVLPYGWASEFDGTGEAGLIGFPTDAPAALPPPPGEPTKPSRASSIPPNADLPPLPVESFLPRPDPGSSLADHGLSPTFISIAIASDAPPPPPPVTHPAERRPATSQPSSNAPQSETSNSIADSDRITGRGNGGPGATESLPSATPNASGGTGGSGGTENGASPGGTGHGNSGTARGDGGAPQGVPDGLPVPNARNRVPIYPPQALRKNLSGTVVLELDLDDSGKVTDARVRQTSGHEILDRSALDAARTWHFTPARLNGRPIALTVTRPVNFIPPR